MPANRVLRRLLIAGTAASMLLLVGSFAFVQTQTDATWTEMVHSSEQLREGWQTRTQTRAPLWGEAVEDQAFAHYEVAARLTQPLVESHHQDLVELLTRNDEELAASSGKLRPRWHGILAELQSGAHASNVAYETHSDPATNIVGLLDYRWIANFATFEARAMRQAGEHVICVRRTLDAATLGADLVKNGILVNQMIGLAVIAIPLAAWHDEALAAAPREALDLLATGLARLDEQLPEHLILDRELLFMAECLQRATDQSEWCGPGTWRYGFSTRWMVADGFLQTLDTLDRMVDPEGLSWQLRRQQLQEQNDRLMASENPAAAMMSPHLVSAETNRREMIANLRMLRLAIDLHRGIEDTSLTDPLGNGPLQVGRRNGQTVIYSAGSSARRRLERIVSR